MRRILCHYVYSHLYPVLAYQIRFFITTPIQHSTVHIFLYTPVQIDAPCRLEAHYAGNKKCLIVLHSTAAPLTTEHEDVSTCTTRMYSSITFYAQDPALKIVHPDREGLSTHVQREYLVGPLCVEPCFTKDLPMSPRFSPTFFYRDSNSVFLQAHLCTAVGSISRTLCSKLFVSRA